MGDRMTAPVQSWEGYVSADGGTVSAMTAVALTAIRNTEAISYSTSTKKITLPLGYYRVEVQLDQTGASATFEIYDTTNSAVIRTSPSGAGMKTLIAAIRNSTATRDIQVRIDDQTANGSTPALGIVLISEI